MNRQEFDYISQTRWDASVSSDAMRWSPEEPTLPTSPFSFPNVIHAPEASDANWYVPTDDDDDGEDESSDYMEDSQW
jgi:hypothetical protein